MDSQYLVTIEGQVKTEKEENIKIKNIDCINVKINDLYYCMIDMIITEKKFNHENFIKDIINDTRNLIIKSGIIEITHNEEEKFIMSYNKMNLKWDILRKRII